MTTRLIVGISGSSGPQLGYRLLRTLATIDSVTTHLVISRGARRTIELELGVPITELTELADVTYEPEDLGAAISSGSFQTAGMAVVPCSMRTLAAIASGNTTDLLTRAADVCLKERRRLVLATREAPLNLIHIRNMETVTLAGATVFPPVPAFYHRPRDIDELIDHVNGRILDQFGIEHQLFTRWGE
ncbi:MAG TPA: UbiX family flavin prenyltransferase [Solirubrobacteraceae bacterium]|nr:UbiX family flavin prenyltransferase [Solirubrobacteraceae bacterium]